MDRRCPDQETAAQLRSAVQMYLDSGGALAICLREDGSDEASGGSTTPTAPVQRHRILEDGFRLQSKAFMLTYNCRSFSTGTWGTFLRFVKVTAQRLQARRWAACLEESLSASGPSRVYHTHALFVVGRWERHQASQH